MYTNIHPASEVEVLRRQTLCRVGSMRYPRWGLYIYIYVHVCVYLYLSFSLSLYIYIYIYIELCHLRPVHLLRVRLSEGLTQANS